MTTSLTETLRIPTDDGEADAIAAYPGNGGRHQQVAALAAFHAPVHAAGSADLHRLTARVHFGHAESDLTPEALNELNRTLDAAGIDYTSEIYPGTVHGFTMSDTDAFDPAALRRHWDRLLPLLAEQT